jgi:hypothetical protein
MVSPKYFCITGDCPRDAKIAYHAISSQGNWSWGVIARFTLPFFSSYSRLLIRTRPRAGSLVTLSQKCNVRFCTPVLMVEGTEVIMYLSCGGSGSDSTQLAQISCYGESAGSKVVLG